MIEQVMIIFTSVTSVWLTQQSNKELKRYACLFGLLAQPFWFYTTYKAEQWGIFSVSFIYSGIWLMGFYNNWVKI